MTPTMDQLDSMGPQGVFNFVAAHLLRQRRRALNREGQCQYRAHDGSMCAVGCLIPDAYYDRSMEGRYVSDLAGCLHATQIGVRLGRFMLRHAALLDELQRVHDRCETPTWREHLVTVALRYGLNPGVAEHGHLRHDSALILLRFDLLPCDLLPFPMEVRHVVTQREEAREAAAA